MYSSLIYLLKSSPELQFFSSANFLSFSRSSFVSLNLKTSALSFIFLLPFNISNFLRYTLLRQRSPNPFLSSGRASFTAFTPARYARMLIKPISRTRSRLRHSRKAVNARECVAMVYLGLNAPAPIYFFSLSLTIFAN